MKIFRKNNSKGSNHVMADIRQSSFRNDSKTTERRGYFSRAGWRPKEQIIIRNRFRWLKRTVFGIIAVLFLLVGGYSAYLWVHRYEVVDSISEIFGGLRSAGSELTKLETDGVSESLAKINSNIEILRGLTKYLTGTPFLKQVPDAFSKVKELVARVDSINKGLVEVKDNGVKLFFKDSGGRLLEILRTTEGDLVAIRSIAADLYETISRLNKGSILEGIGPEYLSFSASIDRVNAGLTALIALLERPGEVHFAVAFENPSEIRPSGGFNGSYADLVLENGEISKIGVDDIYHPDLFTKVKVVPPIQLQTITPGWGARDANWFFDFRTSAMQLMDFLESSDIYRGQGVRFDGVVAINVRVMEDILRIIGDISLPQYKLVLNSSNFLREVQEEVEAGQDKKPGQNPKKILSVITPIIIERLQNLTDIQKEEVLGLLGKRLANKDIKLYFHDNTLESIVLQYGVTGDVFQPPAGWNGDYLAVVNANIAGGKSDAFISQSIELISVIGLSGEVKNTLAVKRTHGGGKQKESWYRATNQNYLKVFTLPNVRLADAKGGGTKVITPKVDYKKGGYAVDADLDAVEKTLQEIPEFKLQRYEESGKSVFATWINVAAGQSKTLELNYQNPRKLVLSDGLKYSFVLDKQSGVESAFKYSIEAPDGFIWIESESAVFTYYSASLPSRLVLELTLRSADI